MLKFPSIDQFRNVIRHVQTQTRYAGKDETGEPIYDGSRELPKLKFQGTVKLHGTNAGVVYDVKTHTIEYQSRERILSLTSDNAGFMLAQKRQEDAWKRFFEREYNIEIDYAKSDESPLSKIAVYGEWCGSGIQKGVAISQLPKMFVVFAMKYLYEDGTSDWAVIETLDFDQIVWRLEDVYNVEDFGTYHVEIDFAHPELAQNKMIDITMAVEEECPVGKHFGVSGIGEGVVWCAYGEGEKWNTSGMWFKVKGEKHSASKVKKLASVDVEAVQAVADFIEMAVTESRLEQGLHVLKNELLLPLEMKSMGDFIRWVFNDILKEEMDTIIASQIDPKKLGGPIANKARPWFTRKINEGVGLQDAA